MMLKRAWKPLCLALVTYFGRAAVRAVYRESPEMALPRGAGSLHQLADGPSQPRPRRQPDWKQAAKHILAQIGEDRVMAEAASVTYFTLLALFPAMAALISFYGLIADPSTIGKDLDAISGVVPGGGMQIIGDQIHSLTSAPQKALGFGAVIGLLTSIWSANAGVKSMFDALNAVNGVRETRSFVHVTWLSLAFTAGALAFVIVATTAVVIVPAVLAYVGFVSASGEILSLARWPGLLAGFLLFLALIYRYGPSHAGVRWQWISWGSVFAAVAWIAASIGFSWYVANFGSYNRTYGSLGAAVGFMTWIWISTIIILVGAELNAEIARQAAPPHS